jgi:hypothetical protein
MMIYSCREAARLLSVQQDQPLALSQRVALGLHTAACRACRAYARQIRLIDAVFIAHAQLVEASLPVSPGLDAAAKARLRERLAAHHAD